jgi:hypothetical protein
MLKSCDSITRVNIKKALRFMMHQVSRCLLMFFLSLLALGVLTSCVEVPKQAESTPSAALQPTRVTLPVANSSSMDSDASPLLALPTWVPEVQWKAVIPATDSYEGRPIFGISRIGTGISPNYLVPDIQPAIREGLMKRGWKGSATAAMPGGSSYGFTLAEGGKQRFIALYYHTRATITSGTDEPIRFAACPCPYELTVFFSDLF